MPDLLSVLVVDDCADLRDLIGIIINKRADWQVVATAADGHQALATAQTCQPDLVLLDIAMPVMDGMEALPLIREAAPEATVVMLSGYPFANAGQGALDAGAHGYVEKADLVRGLIPRLELILGQRTKAKTELPTALRPSLPADVSRCESNVASTGVRSIKHPQRTSVAALSQ